MSKTNLVRTSRDGDQFHYLWAARRCLKLLSADGDLVAISIEGPSPDEQTDQPPVSEGEELIDIAEYFGSENIQDARLVRYMQLKHSTVVSGGPDCRAAPYRSRAFPGIERICPRGRQ